MSDLGKAYVQIVPSAKGISGKIRKVLDDEAGPAGDSAGQTIGSRIKSMLLKAGIGTAIVTGIKASMSEGAALEQSMGGIETLFKSSASKVEEYAKQAYKNAGVSANTYMEQVTSFSASLLQSLGGDTAAAAEYANTAMGDMSDNANKFGTNIQDIQNAYQGFAKQNYTMLDNLKLGYGGTKEEMERLIEDANKLREEQGKNADLTIDSYADVVEAIHTIQENMDVTGTTAKEAATTFSGSFGSMKAAAQDFLGTLANYGGDSELFGLQESMQNLVSSFSTFFFGNFIPMLGRIIANVPVAIGGFLNDNIDAMTQNGVEMINQLASGLSEGIPQLLEQALPMLVQLTGKIRENAGKMVEAGLNLLVQLAQGITNGLPALIENVPQIIINICGVINDNMPKILAAGVQIIVILAKGIIESIPTIIANIGKIVEAIFSVITAVSWINLGGTIVTGLKNGISNLASLPTKAMNSIKKNMKDTIKGSSFYSVGKGIVDGIVSGVKGAAKSLINSMSSLASSALKAAKSKLGIGSPSKEFRDQVGQWIPSGIAVGINAGEDGLTDSVQAVVDDALSLAKSTVSGVDIGMTRSLSSYGQTADVSSDNNILNDVVELLTAIRDKSSDVYLDNTKVTAKITKEITKQTNARIVFAGGY